MFLKIPDYRIVNFDMVKFAEHVLNESEFTTRSQERPILNAVSAIVAAKDGVAELVDADAKDFQEACQAVKFPKLKLTQLDHEKKPFGEPVEVPRAAFYPFYEAVEGMTAERPESAVEAESSESLPVAAE